MSNSDFDDEMGRWLKPDFDEKTLYHIKKEIDQYKWIFLVMNIYQIIFWG